MRDRAGSVVLILLVLAPLAQAAAVDGVLTISAARLPPGASLRLHHAGAFLDHVGEASGLVATSSRVEVQRFSYDTVQAGPVQRSTTNKSASYALTDVRLELTSGQGYFGIYPSPQTVATLAGDLAMTLTPTRSSQIGNLRATTGTDANGPFFTTTLPGTALTCQCAGRLTLDGRFAVKIFGPEITLTGAENTSREPTGTSSSIGPLGATGTTTWLVLTLEEASLTLVLDQTSPFIAQTASFAGTGAFAFSHAQGEITTPQTRYLARGEEAQLDGLLTGTLAPHTSDTEVITAALQGDAEVRNLAATAPVGAGATSRWSFLLLGALFVAAAGAGGVVVFRQRARPRVRIDELSVDDCRDMASIAAQEERYQAALEWNRRAQRLLPSPNAMLLIDEAWYLAQTGELEQALNIYEQASRLGSDGQADFLIAVLLLKTQAPAQRVVFHLVRALEREPSIVLEIEDDERFAKLQDPALARAMREAQSRVE